jgi:hypothetical protein
MSLRRFVPLALVLGALACQPSIPDNTNPSTVDYAVFDPTTSSIPVPNDLALATAASVSGTQGALLQSFASNGCLPGKSFPACGGWPNDLEVPITIGFVRVPVAGGTPTAPDIDPASIKWCPGASCNVALLKVGAAGAAPVNPTNLRATYAAGTLAIHNYDPVAKKDLPWDAGARYVVAVRSGSSGLPTKDGSTVNPQPAMYLLLQDKDLSDPANQGLLPGTDAEKMAAGQQLEVVRRLYALPQAGAPVSIFGLVDSQFPHREIADLASFNVVAGTFVAVDPAKGVAPLPSDFLLDPANGNKTVQNLPAAFGPLAPGIATLDGFSTTAMILAFLDRTPKPVAPAVPAVRAASVAAADPAAQSVFLFELGASGPVLVYDVFGGPAAGQRPTYLPEPPPITQDTGTGKPCASPPYAATCVSTVVGLQPAVVVPGPTGPVALPPLKEKTEYAVVITSRVLDADGNPLVRAGAGYLLSLGASLADASGHSQVPGVPDAEAALLEPMRAALAPALAKLPAPLTRGNVAMAYTFRTQTITSPAIQLGAAPYAKNPANPTVDLFPAAPLAKQDLTVDQAAKKYGVPLAAIPVGVSKFIDATIVTVDELDPQSGAFYADSTKGVPTPIPALFAVPLAPAPAAGWPMVVFRHGLGGGRAQMLPIASALAGGGNMVVAAIDAAKHGDRSWCLADADCAGGVAGSCDHTKFGNQGDPAGGTPGLCTAGVAYSPVVSLPACSSTVTTNCWDGSGGVGPSNSWTHFYTTPNFFRWRDTARQDILDQSMLVRVATTAAGQTVLGLTIDPTKVYYIGQSLGALNGTLDVAANPRISRAVLNVGGATWMDIAATSPAFQPLLSAWLQALGITPGTSQFLQFIQVGKWVLDPSDPVNFASHLVASPLPNLLANPNGSVAQSPKLILGQAARCDSVVPNPTNQLLFGNVGLAPLGPLATSASASLQWFMVDQTTACPADGSTGTGGATHGFLLDGANLSLTTKAQTSAAAFFASPTPPAASTPVIP